MLFDYFLLIFLIICCIFGSRLLGFVYILDLLPYYVFLRCICLGGLGGRIFNEEREELINERELLQDDDELRSFYLVFK